MAAVAVYWAIFIVFIAALTALGAFSYRVSRKSFADYAIAGGTLGYVAVYFYLTWTLFSAFTVMGIIDTTSIKGIAFQLGPGFGIAADMLGVLVFGFWFIAYRELYNASTPAEVFGIRYQSKLVRVLMAALWYIFLCAYIALQLAAVARLMEPLFGVSYVAGCIIALVIITVYLYLGGARAAAWTSVLMGVIATIGVILPFAYILGTQVSWADVIQHTKYYFTTPGPLPSGYTLWGALAFLPLIGLAALPWPHRVLVAMSARSKRVLKMAALLMLPTHVVVITIGAIVALALAKYVIPDVTRAVYLTLIMKLCPPGFDFLYFLVVVGAALTTGAAQMLLCGSLFSRDIWHVIRPKAGERELIYVNIAFGVIAAIIGLTWSILSPISVGFYLTHIAAPGLGIGLPVFLGMIWRRGTRQGAIAALITGLAACLLFAAYPPIFSWFPYPPTMPMIIATIVWLIVSLATKEPEEVLVKYYDEVKAWIKKAH